MKTQHCILALTQKDLEVRTQIAMAKRPKKKSHEKHEKGDTQSANQHIFIFLKFIFHVSIIYHSLL